jgi:hypothetical protein
MPGVVAPLPLVEHHPCRIEDAVVGPFWISPWSACCAPAATPSFETAARRSTTPSLLARRRGTFANTGPRRAYVPSDTRSDRERAATTATPRGVAGGRPRARVRYGRTPRSRSPGRGMGARSAPAAWWLRRGTFLNTGARQRERNEQRSHRADGATVSRCARPVGVSKRQQD